MNRRRPTSNIANFTPLLLPGMQEWHDASNINGNNTAGVNGASIATWADLKGNFPATQPSATSQPTLYTNERIPFVRFDGTNDFLNSNFNFNYTVNPTVVAVFLIRNYNNGGVNQGLCGHDDGTFDRDICVANSTYGRSISNGSTFVGFSGLGVTGVWQLLIAQWKQTTSSGSFVYVNSDLRLTFTDNHNNIGETKNYVGNLGNYANFYALIDIAAYGYLNVDLSALSRTTLIQYCRERYKI